MPWRRKWQPAQVSLPGKSHGQRSLAGYSLWGHKELGLNHNTFGMEQYQVEPVPEFRDRPNNTGLCEIVLKWDSVIGMIWLILFAILLG